MTTSLREVLEALAQQPGGLSKEADATALLDIHLGRVQACQHTDELSDLVAVRDGALQALKSATALVASVPVVESHARALRAAIEPLQRLIVAMQQEPAKAKPAKSEPAKDPVAPPEKPPVVLTGARKGIREASQGGKLVEQLKDAKFLNEVNDWMKTADPADPEQRADMVAVLKAMDPADKAMRQQAFELTFKTKVTKSEERKYVPVFLTQGKDKGKPSMDPKTGKQRTREELSAAPLDPAALTAMADIMAQLPAAHMPSAWILLGQDADDNTRGSFNDLTDIADLQFSLKDVGKGIQQSYASNCEKGDPLENAKAFDVMVRHECGHKAAATVGSDTLTSQPIAGAWIHHDTASKVLDAIGGVYADFVVKVKAAGGPEEPAIRKAVVNPELGFDPEAIAEALGIKDPSKFPADHTVMQVFAQGAGKKYLCGTSPVEVGGRMYVVGGPDAGSWYSFSKASWDKRVSYYQFAAPNEWFAEFYATANNGDAKVRQSAKQRYPDAWKWLKDHQCIVFDA